MSFQAIGPGKTAPRLAHDFKLFDPLNAEVKILSDQTILATDHPSRNPHPRACRHDYAIKHGQSTLPPEDLRSRDAVEPFKAAVVCKKCRIHAEVVIDLVGALDPCPNSDFPVHHFQRTPGDDVESQTLLRYVWRCSGPACNAVLWIDYRMPRLDEEAVRLLTQTDVLNARFHDIMKRDPERDGMRQATPMDVLTRLRRYMHDASKPEHSKREFPANNKRFMEAFGYNGADCRYVLENIGFKYAMTGDGNSTWTLPDPGKNGELFTALEDYDYEIRALMDKRARQSTEVNPAAELGWPSAIKDIDRVLGTQGCKYQHTQPCFAGLGALSDFNDALVEFAYDRQFAVDPTSQPLWLSHLQQIASDRQSDSLQIKVATLASMGYVSRKDLDDAYREIGVSAYDSDERILNLFQAVLPDSSLERQNTLRSMLSKIGTFRDSQALKNAATQTLETYEEALQWLGQGADKNTSDDFIITLYTMKVQEHSSNEEVGKKALSLIAQARQSKILQSFASTGKMDDYQMSLDDACEYLNMKRTDLESIADSLDAVFLSARTDRPNDQTEKAIKTIQEAMSGGSGTTVAIEGPHTLENWPVGLTSHGNTCYLNSILQYYFSIKPLREIATNFDKEKSQDPDLRKAGFRVGQLEPKPIEIAAGIKFAESLGQAFESMITAPTAKVRPDDVLVCRTFLLPEDENLLKVEDEQAQEQERVRRLTDANKSDRPTSLANGGESIVGEVITEEPEEGDMKSESVDINGPPQSLTQTISEQKPPLPVRKPNPRRESAVTKSALSAAEGKAREQHDVTEVHDTIMNRLRAGIEPLGKDADGEQIDKVRAIFAIKHLEKRFSDSNSPKAKEQVREYIQMSIPLAPIDLYSALEDVLDPLGSPGDVEMHSDLVTLPDIIQINMSRNTYAIIDGVYQPYKALSPIYLEDELYLDRFHDRSHPETAERRRRCWRWRKRMAELRREQQLLVESPETVEMNAAMAATESAKYLKEAQGLKEHFAALGIDGINIDDGLVAALSQDGDEKAKRVTAIEHEIKQIEQNLDGAWTDLKSYKYRLHAVFVHRGSTGSGHYWVYIHDFKNDIWRCYNDETVTAERNLAKIMKTSNSVDGTPTYASYVRDEAKDQVIEPLCRRPLNTVDETPEGHDNIMANALGDDTGWGSASQLTSLHPTSDQPSSFVSEDVSKQIKW
ncbi:cysteine proteinase [Polychaeton citri CBS 116435]|uniref:ubiquitinyl hydrolase 1 n=1 Tax=Polychaeton citri CBS 116435 TaxID=1314669 RepID=A0A9P4Q3F4_9PEZI|nr:cysteine proteinase [Polychaeton citri CBS 116435]